MRNALVVGSLFLAGVAVAKRGASVVDFLDATADDAALGRLHPARTKIVRGGARYESEDAAHEEPKAEAILEPATVLEEHARRLRVLCSEHTHRIAVWLDRADLASVAKRDLVLVNKLPVVKGALASSVGIQVRAGTIVEDVEPEANGVAHANAHGLFFAGGGYTSASNIGVSYLPSAPGARSTKPFDGEIMQAIDVLDTPNGTLVAHIEKQPGDSDKLYVRKLATQGAWVKLAYDEDDLAVVGWAKREDLHWFDKPKDPGGYGYGSGSGSGVLAHMIEVKKGMHLYGRSGAAIGVVLENTRLKMAPDSTDDAPWAEVAACGGHIEVTVR